MERAGLFRCASYDTIYPSARMQGAALDCKAEVKHQAACTAAAAAQRVATFVEQARAVRCCLELH